MAQIVAQILACIYSLFSNCCKTEPSGNHTSEIQRDGEEIQRDGEEIQRDGEEIQRDGEEIQRDGEEIQRDGEEIQRDGEEIQRDGEEIQRDGEEIQRDGEEIQRDGEEIQRDGEEIQRDGEEVKRYLELIEKIMEQARQTTSASCSKPPQFYCGQCNYLGDKLELAVKCAQSSLVPFIDGRYTETSCSSEDMARFLDACKQLYASAELVQSFIQECCKTSWTQAALGMLNASEHVSSIGFDLEICILVFSNVGGRKKNMLSSLGIDELANREGEIVKQKVKGDKRALLERVEALCQSSESSYMDCVRGKRLLAALKPSSDEEGYCDQDVGSVPQIGALGSGAGGVVHRGIWYKSIDVARKVIYGTDERSQREKLIQGRLSHSNVTFLFCYGNEDEDHTKTTLLMDLMEGNLFDLIGKRMKRGRIFPFPILVAVDIMLQVGTGMHYTHESSIVHRDLKPQNIFSRHVRRTEFVQVKVGDFGAAKIVEGGQPMTPMQGTVRYMAPEMMLFSCNKKNAEKKHYELLELPYCGVMKKHPYKCDTHSFAMLCFEILTGKQPFSEKQKLGDLILGGERPMLPEWCPEKLKDLIERCWSNDVNVRPSFGVICKELRHIKYSLLITGLEAKQTLDLRRPHENNEENHESSFPGDNSSSGDESFSSADEISLRIRGRMHGWIEDELDPFVDSLEDEENKSCELRKLFEEMLEHEQDERITHNLDRCGPCFLQNMDDLVLEDKISEGAEAELFGARGGLVVKLYWGTEIIFEDFEGQFDVGILIAFRSGFHDQSPLSLIKGGTLLRESRVQGSIGGSFGIVMERKWGDLRMLMDLHMKENRKRNKSENGAEDPPFTEVQSLAMMLGIAKDMKTLHSLSPPVLHRDIKSANVLVEGPHLPKLDGAFKVTVCDYGSLWVRGSGFWRAPEILIHLKNRTYRTFREIKFTKECDVYSYGMTCYELVTGRIPFEGENPKNYDIVLLGGRPVLPNSLHHTIKDVIVSCWEGEPSKRPSFDDIVDRLSLMG